MSVVDNNRASTSTKWSKCFIISVLAVNAFGVEYVMREWMVWSNWKLFGRMWDLWFIYMLQYIFFSIKNYIATSKYFGEMFFLNQKWLNFHEKSHMFINLINTFRAVTVQFVEDTRLMFIQKMCIACPFCPDNTSQLSIFTFG